MFTKTIAKTLFAAAVAATGTAALADDITIVADNFRPQLTRAEVHAQVLQARAAGTMPVYDESSSAMSQFAPDIRSAVSRDAVRAELRASKRVPVTMYNPDA